MMIKISDQLSFEDGFELNPFAFYGSETQNEFFIFPDIFEEKKYILLQGKKYPVLPVVQLAWEPGSDGKYHALYIWINFETGEYYIGKVNRKRWAEIKRYTGSGVVFKRKYDKYSDKFVRYYLFACDSQEETERIESELVNETLLKDPFCLNLIRGGGGVCSAPVSKYKKAQQSQYMKQHPERYEAMVNAAKHFDTEQIQQRSQKIKETMSSEKYREMFKDRIAKWKQDHPEEYQESRKKNKESLNDPSIKARRNEALSKWKKEHPEEYKIWEDHRKEALANPQAKQKRSESLKNWIRNHPEEHLQQLKNAHQASKEVVAKAVDMLDLKTDAILMSFSSVSDAGKWLIEQGYTKGVNPSSGIVGVCKKKVIPGHGIKKSYLGFGWKYKDK